MKRTAVPNIRTTRSSTTRVAVGTAAGVAIASLGLFAAPAFASNGVGSADGACDGTGIAVQDGSGLGYGSGQGNRRGAQGGQPGSGMSTAGHLAAYPTGDLTDEQKAELVYWVEEEKVAHDLYTAFAAQYETGPFERIATSETRHLDAVRTLLDRYGLEDPTDGAAVGAFENDDLAALYTGLLDQGDNSYADAMAVGREVETTDLKDLTVLLDGLEAPDVQVVAGRQVAASERHLAAFDG
jgi:hypothetical protein